MDAALCVIVKDEDLYIHEWVQYNLKLGFSRIYMYDNTDECRLRPNIYHKYPVTLVHLPGRELQMVAYNHCLDTFGHLHTWIAFVDADEFIVLRKHESIVSLLNEHCQSGALCLNWYFFGSSGYLHYTAEPVLSRFMLREAGVNEHVKTIVKTSDAVRMLNPHFLELKLGCVQRDTSGRQFYGAFNFDGPTDVAVINHYFTKSRDEFDRKRMRGKADLLDIRMASDFERMDKNEVFDNSAWVFMNSA